MRQNGTSGYGGGVVATGEVCVTGGRGEKQIDIDRRRGDMSEI